MVQSVPYRLFEITNNSRRAQALQLYQLSVPHWNQWGCWLEKSLLPLADHGGFELMKGCLLQTKFLHILHHASSLYLPAGFSWSGSLHYVPHALCCNYCLISFSFSPSPSCPIIWIFLLEPLLWWSVRYCLSLPSARSHNGAGRAMLCDCDAEMGSRGDKKGLKWMTRLSCEHVTYRIGPSR